MTTPGKTFGARRMASVENYLIVGCSGKYERESLLESLFSYVTSKDFTIAFCSPEDRINVPPRQRHSIVTHISEFHDSDFPSTIMEMRFLESTLTAIKSFATIRSSRASQVVRVVLRDTLRPRKSFTISHKTRFYNSF